jgi:tRNA pseudouridine32 synthase/23S rRNA pseudouridine746 synthase
MSEKFTLFKNDISGYSLPEKFTFPFYYKPHILAEIATKELQLLLSEKPNWNRMFGLDSSVNIDSIGKMFGVLVVKKSNGDIGYLSSVSGKLFDSNNYEEFVPPVFDTLVVDSFFNSGINLVNQLISKINTLETQTEFINNNNRLKELQSEMSVDLLKARRINSQAKKARDLARNKAKIELFGDDYKVFNDRLKQESANNKFYITHLSLNWEEKINELKDKVDPVLKEIASLKNERHAKSASLQQKLFEQYNFLNINGDTKSLLDIFKETALLRPPAAAGECAAPKLLNYAFQYNLKPIALAEFWWGKSPKSEIRTHKNFYPACQGKCKPILGHMLKGLSIDDNPMLQNNVEDLEIETLFEDDYMVVINKPAELLSVPGVNIKDCVAQRMKDKYPKATGPLTVHRLDMQTSGILLIAKTLEVHKVLQKQFMDRTIKKRYVALLDGNVKDDKGIIELPLRPDIDDRPRQLVCYEHGKSSKTIYNVIERINGTTRIHFYPVTGRTHQLRVHAAHNLGLNTAIVGDDLYGKPAYRLHLHAEFIQFVHPITNKTMKVEVGADF